MKSDFTVGFLHADTHNFKSSKLQRLSSFWVALVHGDWMQLKYLKVKHIMVWQTCDNEHTAAASLIVIYELGSIVFLADPIAHTRIYGPFTPFGVTNLKKKKFFNISRPHPLIVASSFNCKLICITISGIELQFTWPGNAN